MKTLFILLAMASQCFGQTWNLFNFTGANRYSFTGSGTSFAFPQASTRSFPALLTTTTDSSVLGNLNGKTLTATIHIDADSGALFVFGGELPGWNTGNQPANCRLFFSSSASTYNLNIATAKEDNYWWSHVGVSVITNNLGTVSFSDNLDPSHWSNANGHLASNRLAGFNQAVANVRQIGLSFGGGSFFDVGVALNNGTGPATFTLLSFTEQ